MCGGYAELFAALARSTPVTSGTGRPNFWTKLARLPQRKTLFSGRNLDENRIFDILKTCPLREFGRNARFIWLSSKNQVKTASLSLFRSFFVLLGNFGLIFGPLFFGRTTARPKVGRNRASESLKKWTKWAEIMLFPGWGVPGVTGVLCSRSAF